MVPLLEQDDAVVEISKDAQRFGRCEAVYSCRVGVGKVHHHPIVPRQAIDKDGSQGILRQGVVIQERAPVFPIAIDELEPGL